jgi:ribosome-binding protein aMBF1 (putative translation factor)
VPRRRTAFDRDFDTWMNEPEFAAGYARARARIDAIDHIVRQLDAAREQRGFSKADIARELEMEPSVVRRLFTHPEPNPQVGTVFEIANLLGMEVVLLPRGDQTDVGVPREVPRAAQNPSRYAPAR